MMLLLALLVLLLLVLPPAELSFEGNKRVTELLASGRPLMCLLV
jgi:hypothetical protein